METVQLWPKYSSSHYWCSSHKIVQQSPQFSTFCFRVMNIVRVLNFCYMNHSYETVHLKPWCSTFCYMSHTWPQYSTFCFSANYNIAPFWTFNSGSFHENCMTTVPQNVFHLITAIKLSLMATVLQSMALFQFIWDSQENWTVNSQCLIFCF